MSRRLEPHFHLPVPLDAEHLQLGSGTLLRFRLFRCKLRLCSLNSLYEAIQLFLRPVKPIDTPDAMQQPAMVFENGSPEPVAIAGRTRAFVGRTIALDPQHIAARRFRIDDGKINEAAGDADTGMNLVPPLLKRRSNLRSEGVARRLRPGTASHVEAACSGEMKE